MTATLYKSELPADFEGQLESYRQQLLKHRFTEKEAAPALPPLFEKCIVRVQYPVDARKPDDFVSDYKVIDDTPLPPTLRERKDRLIEKVTLLEQEAVLQIQPPGKVRLHAYQRVDILSKELKTAADEAFLAEDNARHASLDKIHRTVAHSLSEIEDLTEDNIDSWVPPPLK